jgi:hypothetical protein
MAPEPIKMLIGVAHQKLELVEQLPNLTLWDFAHFHACSLGEPLQSTSERIFRGLIQYCDQSLFLSVDLVLVASSAGWYLPHRLTAEFRAQSRSIREGAGFQSKTTVFVVSAWSFTNCQTVTASRFAAIRFGSCMDHKLEQR